MRYLSQGCVYAGCYSAWVWLCLAVTATTLDESEVMAVLLFFAGAAIAETIRSARNRHGSNGATDLGA